MTPEVALWAFGAALIPAIGWGVALQWQIMATNRDLQQLIELHKNPDNTGFGTRPLEELVKTNTRAMEGMMNAVNMQTAWFRGQAGKPLPGK